jgi:hypothetical protein
MAGGFAGAQAPYAEYQAWQPHGAPGGFPGPDGYGEMVNGGDYAYVIRHGDPASPFRPDARGQGLDGWSTADQGTAPGRTAASGGQPSTGGSAGAGASAGSAQAGVVRAITSGTVGTEWPARADGRQEAASAAGPSSAPGSTALAGAPATAEPATQADTAIPAGARPRPEAAPEIDPALAYGPDDPAYGPPGPDWYKRDEERAARTGDGESPAAAGEPAAARGPFEPLRPGDREGAGHAYYQQADGDAAFDDPDADPLESEVSEYEPIDYEMSELLDLGTPTDPEAGALGQIRDLYQAAESVSQASLDRHFDQLLERQRELISEFFTESGGPGAGAAPVAPADGSSPFGFDTAESLTGLRGELRGAQ